MEATLLFIIEVIGTLAFAVSGIRLAAKKHFEIGRASCRERV